MRNRNFVIAVAALALLADGSGLRRGRDRHLDRFF